MTTALIYCRYSDRPGADACESNAVQAASCRRYCEAKQYDVAEVVEDQAISGANEDRPLLWRAVDSLKKGYVLVAYRADRLARGVYLSEVLHRAVAKRRARIEVVDGSSNGDGDHDVLVRQILAAVAEMERKVIAARTKNAMLFYQSQGRMMSAAAPFGTQRGPDREVTDGHGRVKLERTLAPDPAEMAIVARVLTATAAGQKPSEIARELESDGVACRGEAWHRTTVSRIVARYQQP